MVIMVMGILPFAIGFKSWLFTLISFLIIVLGMILYFKGVSSGFDFKRQSGHIIYGGDQ